jgi:hypothetical protein
MQKLSFDPTKDLTPVGMVTVNGMAFTVHPDLPVHSLVNSPNTSGHVRAKSITPSAASAR